MFSALTSEHSSNAARSIQLARPAMTDLVEHRPAQTRLDRTSVRRFLSKEHVFCEGDARTHVFQIEDGVVTIYRMLSDGRRQIIDFAYPGEFVGLGTTPEHFFSAEATSATRVRCFSAGALEEAAAHDPSLALQLYKAVSLELSAARALLVAIGQRSALERVATFLLMLSRRATPANGSEHVVHLAMRRADIGDFLGLTIETVSRTITKLRAMRIIEVLRGTEIRILDADRLEELSEGEDSV
jgi:CRP/FNR family transcriptional regulator, anaerobic regulatory protein